MNPFVLASQGTKKKSSPKSTKIQSPKRDDSKSAFCECPVCGNIVLEANINFHLDTECMKNKKSTNKYTQNENIQESSSSRSSIPIDLSESTNSPSKHPLTSEKKTQLSKEDNKPHISLQDQRKPLAERMRPNSFEELFGNTELIGSQSLLRRILTKDPPPSIILYGPPGCGKTSIAYIIQKHTHCSFKQLSATSAGVKDIKDVYDVAMNEYKLTSKPTILFLDEIHRFNKKQQDVFLPYVERGILILIGATTEMPSFCINNALLSRCQVICLNKLNNQDVVSLLNRAITTDPILLSKNLHFPEEVKYYLSIYCDGDGRKALNILDLCINDCNNDKNTNHEITLDYIKELCANKFNYYDHDGEDHYNCISAFIKSIRGSDVQGALYWLVRMIEGGEDPLYISRRMLISSSEDIGLADPMALTYSNSCFQAVKNLGMPECVYALVQNTIYLALTSKSNECYLSLNRARDVIQSNPLPPVPFHIRNAATPLQEQMGYGTEYQYGYNKNQTYLPKGFEDYIFVDVERAMRDLRLPSIRRYMKEHSQTTSSFNEQSNIKEEININPSLESSTPNIHIDNKQSNNSSLDSNSVEFNHKRTNNEFLSQTTKSEVIIPKEEEYQDKRTKIS